MEITRKKVAFHTLGCKLNFAETSTIARSFPEDAFEKVRSGSKADIYVINTCSVTDAADRKCRQAIKKFINQSPDALIAVVGCYAQLNPGEVSAIPGVDIVLGTNEKFDVKAYLSRKKKENPPEIHSCELSGRERFHPSFSAGDRTRAFLKVQDGCDYVCSYCTIPAARGQSRNAAITELVAEAWKIADRGIKEIVLTGVNVGDFGRSTGESLVTLLKELMKVDGIYRYRISSIEPNLLSDELISLAAGSEKIMPHFHIPLQSGSDKILGLMKRRYRRNLFTERTSRILRSIPDAAIGADIIVGFPGESDNDFEDTYRFLEESSISSLHVFNFSERPGTSAALMSGKVNYRTREQRSKRLIALSARKHHSFCEKNIGHTDKVLFEHSNNEGSITGFTGNYLRAEYPWKAGLAGRISTVKLTGISGSGRMTLQLLD